MEKGDFVPDKHLRIPKAKDQPMMNRRTFLAGALAAGAGVFTGAEGTLRAPDLQNWLEDNRRRTRFNRFNGLSPKEREQKIEREAAEVQAFVRSPEGKRILESGTDEELFALLTALPAVLREDIAGTKYDVSQEHWPSVGVSLEFQAGCPQTVSAQTAAKSTDVLTQSGYGNGVFVGPNTLLTNWHIAERAIGDRSDRNAASQATADALKHGYEQGAVDAIFIDTPAGEEHTVLPLDAVMKDADVHGSFVRVAAIDPDASPATDAEGTKLYPSTAIRMTKQLASFIERHAGSGYGHRLSKFVTESFIYIAPPGESMWRQQPSVSGSRAVDALLGEESQQTLYLRGTSGSPVLLGDKLAGLNVAASEISFKGRCIDIGYFYGPDELRRARKSGMTYVAEREPEDFGGSDFVDSGTDSFDH